jgi:hypothetical protein
MRLFGGKRLSRRFVELVVALVVIALTTSSLVVLDAIAGSWLPPQRLTSIENTAGTTGADFQNREVALAPNGTVLAAWLVSDYEGGRVVTTVVRQPGGPFRDTLLLSPFGASASPPELAVDRQGQAIVMWSVNGAVHYSLRRPYGDFGPSQPVPAGTVEAVSDVAFNRFGDAIAIWSAHDEVRVSTMPPGGSFGAPQTLDSLGDHSVAEGSYGAPVLAADRIGNVYAAWDGSGYGTTDVGTSDVSKLRTWISAAIRPPSDAFGPDQSIDGPEQPYGATSCRTGSPQIGGGPDGAVVSWLCRSYSPSNVSEVRTAGLPGWKRGRWSAGGQFDARSPQGVIASDGTEVVGWSANGLGLYFNFWPRGAGPGDPVATDQRGLGPQLAADGKGRVFATWDGSRVMAAIRDRGRQFGQLADVSKSIGDVPGSSDVAADDAGNALATWVKPEYLGLQSIYYAAYDGAGPTLSALRVRKRSHTGKRIVFSVLPFDTWSQIRKTVWHFGDGRRASGARVRHIYRYAGGRFRVTVAATDTAGNSTTRKRWIRIRDVSRPRVKRFRADRRGHLRFRLTERARVRISIARRVGGSYLRFDTIVRKRGKSGDNKVTVRGPAGSYRATIRATDRVGNRSRARSVAFRIAWRVTQARQSSQAAIP